MSTAFIIESYRGLQPDYQAYTANILYLALSSRNGSGDLTLLSTPLPSPNDFTITDTSRWINGLWFTSLVLSLSVALLSILAKQWLDEYLSRIYAPFQSARYWARRRAMYFGGLTSWHLPAFISTLPVLLHISLFFFFSGLVLFLATLDSAIAFCTLTMSSLLLAFYVTTLLLPFWKVDCPTRTPLIGQLPRLWDRAVRAWRWMCVSAIRFLVQIAEYRKVADRFEALSERLRAVMGRLRVPRRRFSMDDRERGAVGAREADLDAVALQWLLTSSAAQEVVATAVQAIGALPPRSETLDVLRTYDMQQLVKDHINANVHVSKQRANSTSPTPMFRSERDLVRYARYIRSWLALNSDRDIYSSDVHLIPYMTRHPAPAIYDLSLLQFILRWTQDHQNMLFLSLLKERNAAKTPFSFLPSTVIQGMGIIVRSSDRHDRKTQALSAVLHLFHAGRLAEAPEHDLLLAVEPVRDLISHLNIHVPLAVDALSGSHSRIVATCIKLWSSVINERRRLNLDAADVSVAAQDLGRLVARLESQSDRASIRSSTLSVDDFSAFATFVASPAFMTHRWELQILEAMSQLLKKAALGLSSADIARSLAHLTHSFTQHLVKDENDAVTDALAAFADDVALIFTTAAYPSGDAQLDMAQHGLDDPRHPMIPPTIAQPAFPRPPKHLELPSHRANLLHGTMLYFLHRPEERTSAWRALHTAGWPAGSQLVVADALAANLCAMRKRGVEVSDLVDEFLAVDFVTRDFMSKSLRLDDQMQPDYEFSLQSLALQSQAEYLGVDLQSEKASASVMSRRTRFSEIERLAQHCGELRSEWWHTACQGIIDSLDAESEPRLQEFVLQLLQLGQEECITCKKATAG